METIEISLAEYYNNSQYFPFMPESIFNALEAAFLDGEEIVKVSKTEFEGMLLVFQNNGQ